MNEHTPTPWKAVDVHSTDRKRRGAVYYQIKPANGAKSSIGFAGVYEGGNPSADADFIVRAVNDYDADKARIAELENGIKKLHDRMERLSKWAMYGEENPTAKFHIEGFMEELKGLLKG